MLRKLFCFCFLTITLVCSAQSDTLNKSDNMLFDDPEIEPQFPGGRDSLKQFLHRETVYPEKYKAQAINCLVVVGFTIEKDGSITDIYLLKETAGFVAFAAEAKRVVASMPRWIPGTMNGKPIRSKCSLPFRFEYVNTAQSDSQPYNDTTIYEVVEEGASYPGGINAFNLYIAKNLVYPAICKDKGLPGAVTVSFVVEKDGSVSRVKIIKGSTCREYNEAIETLMRKMPRWKPAMFMDKPVRTHNVIPIRVNIK